MPGQVMETRDAFIGEANQLALKGLNTRHIAKQMGLTPAAFRKRMSRYRARFRRVAGFWEVENADAINE